MPTPPFSVNPMRIDPYKNFKFIISFDAGKPVAGMSKMSPLRRVTQVVWHREGGDPSSSHKSPSLTEYDPITFWRGVTHDSSFEDWATLVWHYGAKAGEEVMLADFRKDIYIELHNEAGQKVIAYKVYRCWVSEYQPLPELDANQPRTAIEYIKVENEGWERDTSVEEPLEPKG